MDRRSFVKSLGVSLTIPTLEESAPGRTVQSSDGGGATGKAPNVIIMICDDLGYGDLGCYGSSLKTPNLDRMASQGTRLTRFNAAHPICSASRAALLTGRYAQRSHTAGAYFPHSKSGMSLEETTLADLFRARGYRTKCVGKWHLGDAPKYLPTNRGFDSFYGVPYSDDMKPLPLIRDTTVLGADTDRDLLTPRYTDEALKFVRQTSDKPFFLYLAYSYPHDPARASPRFRGHSGFGDYGDAVEEIDWSAGEIMRALTHRGLLGDTLVLFTSDHGCWYQGNPGLLRGRKASTFEGGFRVPLIAHWPGIIPKGEVVDTWGSNLDVVPTLAAFCGLASSPKPLDGENISSLLQGKKSSIDRRTILYFSPMTSGGLDLHCARKGDWKLRVAQTTGEIYISDRGNGKQSFWLARPELYNLARDPTESYDVAKIHPEIVGEILSDVAVSIATFPADVQQAFAKLQQNVARVTTPPGAAPRLNTGTPLPEWAWEPPDRR